MIQITIMTTNMLQAIRMMMLLIRQERMIAIRIRTAIPEHINGSDDVDSRILVMTITRSRRRIRRRRRPAQIRQN